MTSLYQRINGIEGLLDKEHVIAALAPGREDYTLTSPRGFLIQSKIDTSYGGLARYIENYFSERRVRIPDSAETIAGKEPEYLSQRLMWSFRARKHQDQTKKEKQDKYSQHEPLRRIIYGTIRANNLPNELFQQMDAWEAMYFLAGIWNRMTTTLQRGRFSRPRLRRQPIAQIVVETTQAGVHFLERYMTATNANKTLPHYNEVMQNLGTAKKSEQKQEQLSLL